jgi:non-specific serine/threonine protein kinase
MDDRIADPPRSVEPVVTGEAPPDGAERWSRVKTVFLAALDRPEEARDDFVASACGSDATLAAEVRSLLASEHAASSFCETPAGALLARDECAPEEAAPPRLAPGARLGRYEILDFISAGGMGEVYRARHTILDRIVALKTVAAAAGDQDARRRLIREAQHASHLSHPNICTVHEVGDADGEPFIVMEFVDGTSLHRIVRDGAPAPDLVLDYGRQIADALAHAHAHGIVHRDLKSSNVIIDRDGHPIVLDFGLARRLPDERGDASVESTVTKAGTLAGTLTHMAPEVLLGGRADARSDVWSLGVMLHELATGDLPFSGRTPYETTSAILEQPPRPITGRVPIALRLVIERCLQKSPAARYQSAADVRDALETIRRRRAWSLVGQLLISMRWRRLRTVAAAVVMIALLGIAAEQLYARVGPGSRPRISTIAVLPLENSTGDPRAAFYANGLTEGLVEQLGAVGELRVISLTAASAASAAELGADAIVRGRLRNVSDRVTVDIQLVDARRDRVLWSDTYERGARQVLALQADVITALASEVRITVRTAARDRLTAVRAVNPDAYEAYLRGRYEWNVRTPTSLRAAIAHFRSAIELDPTYAPAHAALADCYNQMGTLMVAVGSPKEYRPLARAAAIRALQIDPESPEALAALAYAQHYDWEWDNAERGFRRAIELNPSYVFARVWYANFLMSRRRMDEAIAQISLARELDPFSLIVNSNVGWVLHVAGRREDALAVLRQTLAMDSTYEQARWRLNSVLFATRQYEEAYRNAKYLVAISDSSAPMLGMLVEAAMYAGRRAEAESLRTILVERAAREYVPPATMSFVHGFFGDVDEELYWITKAFDERSNHIVYRTFSGGKWERDPRFIALLTQYGFR